MAQTFLIKEAKQNSKGISYRVIKDRAWDDMPWSYLVQKRVMNYKLGQNRWSWVVTRKFDNEFEAVREYERKTK